MPSGAVAPTDITLSASSISESASVGSVVATISSDGTAPVTFSEIADPDGKFTVSGTQLQLAAALDYATATSHSVTIRATNAAGNFDEQFTITVTEAAALGSPEFAVWSDAEDPAGKASVYLGAEPDYETTLAAEYRIAGGAAQSLSCFLRLRLARRC